jgi:hypothetical protein
MGLLYFTLSDNQHSHTTVPTTNRDRWFVPLFLMMFLSPCLEVEPIFIAAGTAGLRALFLTSVIYALVSIGSMLILTYLAISGIKLLPLHRLEHREKKITGLVLMLVGLISFFVN